MNEGGSVFYEDLTPQQLAHVDRNVAAAKDFVRLMIGAHEHHVREECDGHQRYVPCHGDYYMQLAGQLDHASAVMCLDVLIEAVVAKCPQVMDPEG